MALRALGLDEVWWLVSPQNPLKARTGMADLDERVARAAEVANHPRIRVTDIERVLGTVYTADTLAALRRRFPAMRFTWLMGADNLASVHRWDRWKRIFSLVPIAVFDRPGYSLRALSSLAAHRFAGVRQRPATARQHDGAAPAWTFIFNVRHPASATAIRRRRERATQLTRRRATPAAV